MFGVEAQGARRDLWIVPLYGDRKAFPLRETPFHESGARFSPDGRWIAYSSDEPGSTQVFVEPFTVPASSIAARLQISSGGGDEPEWGSATELFYRAPGNRLMAVQVKTQPALAVGTASFLFEIPPDPYQVADGGRRFLVSVPTRQGGDVINVVLNWVSALRHDH